MRRVSLTVNDAVHELEIEPRELLVTVIRDQLGLTGTNVGCDTSSCGACTILVDGVSVKSCTMLGVQADGASILRPASGDSRYRRPLSQSNTGVMPQKNPGVWGRAPTICSSFGAP